MDETLFAVLERAGAAPEVDTRLASDGSMDTVGPGDNSEYRYCIIAVLGAG